MYSDEHQKKLLAPLEKLIQEDSELSDMKRIDIEVIPAILKKPSNNSNKMFVNPLDLTDWLPNTFLEYRNLILGSR
jgi:hypothetical protein